MTTEKQIYTKDKKVKITFRCEERLGEWVSERAEKMGLTPSAFVRQMLFQNFYGEQTLGEIINNKTSTETAVDKCKHQG